MEYLCVEKSCPFDGNKPFVLSIPTEACVDKHNIAIPFCPYCESELKEKDK